MKLHLLPSITVLPPPHETADDEQVIEDWARGLDWVQWLLSSVRARTEVLLIEHRSQPVADAWKEFAESMLREVLGPALKSAWRSTHEGDLESLIAVSAAMSAQLSPAAAQRSLMAGAVLLKSTRHARYQGILGRLREAVEQDRCASHIAIVWAAVAHVFQLSLANVIAEYLHLEWAILTREAFIHDKPQGLYSIIALTSQLMGSPSSEVSLSVLTRR